MSEPLCVWAAPPPTLVLRDDEVHVWRAGLDRDAAELESLRACLSPDERERADRFCFPIHRARFIVARGVLRTILARYLNVRPATLRFQYGPHGKPSLADDLAAGGLRFNLAHSEGLALFAIARCREVGVDVEHHQRASAHEEIAKRFFHPTEIAALRALPVGLRRQGFFTCWTRKEAVVKATGKGLLLSLQEFAVSLAPGEPVRLLETTGTLAEMSKWRLVDLSLAENFSGALAVERDGWRLCLWEWSTRQER